MRLWRRAGASVDRKRAVIFDFDGTIADSWPTIMGVAEELMGRREHFSDEEIASLRDLSLSEVMKRLGIPKWKWPLLLFQGRRRLRAHLHDIPLHKGMADVLERLHKQGIPLYVLSSNSTENVQKYLRFHKLDRCFTAVYGGASVFGKAPRLLSLIQKEHVDHTTSWYVGDEVRDIHAAHTLRLKIVSVSWGLNTHGALVARRPEVVADSAAELLKVLETAWKK